MIRPSNIDPRDRFWYGLITFGLGLHIPDHEMDTYRTLTTPVVCKSSVLLLSTRVSLTPGILQYNTLALTNDLYSWPKEREAAQDRGEGHVCNAIWVLMEEYKVDVEEAKKICRELIKENVAEYLQTLKDNRNNQSLSEDLRKYVDALQYTISGNLVFSKYCPRYNPNASFNKVQLEWMQNGVPPLDFSNTSAEPIPQNSSCDSPGSKKSNEAPVSLDSTTSKPRTVSCSLTGTGNCRQKTPEIVSAKVCMDRTALNQL